MVLQNADYRTYSYWSVTPETLYKCRLLDRTMPAGWTMPVDVGPGIGFLHGSARKSEAHVQLFTGDTPGSCIIGRTYRPTCLICFSDPIVIHLLQYQTESVIKLISCFPIGTVKFRFSTRVGGKFHYQIVYNNICFDICLSQVQYKIIFMLMHWLYAVPTDIRPIVNCCVKNSLFSLRATKYCPAKNNS